MKRKRSSSFSCPPTSASCAELGAGRTSALMRDANAGAAKGHSRPRQADRPFWGGGLGLREEAGMVILAAGPGEEGGPYGATPLSAPGVDAPQANPVGAGRPRSGDPP